MFAEVHPTACTTAVTIGHVPNIPELATAPGASHANFPSAALWAASALWGGYARPDVCRVGAATHARIRRLARALAPGPLMLRSHRRIPIWYRFGMTTQIAVRLPDDLVAFVDDLVSHGDAASRAAVVSRALERERRRKIAERDAAILASAGLDTDLDSLAEFTATTPMDDLD